jgi:hypothetical protein
VQLAGAFRGVIPSQPSPNFSSPHWHGGALYQSPGAAAAQLHLEKTPQALCCCPPLLQEVEAAVCSSHHILVGQSVVELVALADRPRGAALQVGVATAEQSAAGTTAL